MSAKNQLHSLLDDYVFGQLSEADKKLLHSLLEDPAMALEAERLIHHNLEMGRYDSDMIPEIHARLHKRLDLLIQGSTPVKKINYLKSYWVAAAGIAVILVGVLYLQKDHPSTPTIVQNTIPAQKKQDILPGTDKATLTLSDGRKVELSTNSHEIIADGTLAINNNNGELIYARSTEARMNTMATARGGQYKLVLSDGTRVWLNAETSIRYPTAFTEKERHVMISGEAYFEVAKNNNSPFIVSLHGSPDIKVLGTHFNVNAYADESVVTTTLLEGAIKISDKTLHPGEAWINGEIVEGNPNQAIAWKNGYFSFDEANLQMVMRQLSRWYDVEVEYAANIPKRSFSGEIERSLTLTQVLNGLGKTTKTKIKYQLENGSKVIILP